MCGLNRTEANSHARHSRKRNHTRRDKRRTAMVDFYPHPGSGRKRRGRFDKAAKDAQIAGYGGELLFGVDVNDLGPGGEGVPCRAMGLHLHTTKYEPVGFEP